MGENSCIDRCVSKYWQLQTGYYLLLARDCFKKFQVKFKRRNEGNTDYMLHQKAESPKDMESGDVIDLERRRAHENLESVLVCCLFYLLRYWRLKRIPRFLSLNIIINSHFNRIYWT